MSYIDSDIMQREIIECAYWNDNDGDIDDIICSDKEENENQNDDNDSGDSFILYFVCHWNKHCGERDC